MPQAQIAKAVLIPMNGDQVETDLSKHILVQFNPASLRVTLCNTLRADTHGGGRSVAQFVDRSESSLALELLFDTTTTTPDGGTGDVRQLTQRIADTFMKPLNPEAERPGAPRRCRFQWGSFQFTGMLASYSETLDFFAPEGIPLRATLALSFKEDRYQFGLAEAAAGRGPAAVFAPGGAGLSADRAALAAGADPRDWRELARFNDLENPRFTPASGLDLPTSSGSAEDLSFPTRRP